MDTCKRVKKSGRAAPSSALFVVSPSGAGHVGLHGCAAGSPDPHGGEESVITFRGLE